MKRLTALTALLAFTVTTAACGGSSDSAGSANSGATANQFDGCSSEGATAQASDGTPLQCVINSVGELMWDSAPTPTTLDAGSIADATSTTMANIDPNTQAMPLNMIFSGDCDNNGPTTYSAGIGD